VSGARLEGLRDQLDALAAAGIRTAPIAVAWATVDLDRAAAATGERTEPRAADPFLGATVLVVRPPDGEALALVEPNTEGRLAASLARWGEGPVGRYIAVPDGLDAAIRTLAAAGITLSSPADGPFGRSALVLDGRVDAPHLVLVDPPAGTIKPMIERQSVTLRAASDADADRIAALFTDEGYPSGPSDVVDRLARFASPHSQVIVADYEGEVLGFIAVHSLPRFEQSDRVLRIMALVVDAGVRDRGVGHLLMDEAERIGRELGAAFIEVTAGHHRPDARHLYEALGYDASVAAYLRKRL
jgi:GNAT superfamily N-acetyltransferase